MSFNYMAHAPFNTYYPPAAAPWGRFPDGFAYEAPPTRDCPTCLDGLGAYYQEVTNLPIGAYGALGDGGCGPCQIVSGSQCLPCPNGSSFPECQNCADGAPITAAPSWWDAHPVAAPVLIGVMTMVTANLLIMKLMK
jgi:hypothetical protein